MYQPATDGGFGSQLEQTYPNLYNSWRRVWKLGQLRDFYRLVRAQRIMEAVSLFDQEQFLAAETISDETASSSGGKSALDYSRILEVYLGLLLHLQDSTQRVREVRGFLGGAPHILVSSHSMNLLTELAVRG